ncbi:MAG TPA: methyltransferase domain-containing protein, partial [Bryobacteraceae bacterium]|nr:methyltransferase domain-containing protein [Bryobacteraceae bacterium]
AAPVAASARQSRLEIGLCPIVCRILSWDVVVQQRIIVPEMLDHAGPEEARGNLRDLVRVNKYLGGYGILRRIVNEFVRPGETFSVLDVGAASGDMGAALRRAFPGAVVTSLDRKPNHLAVATDPKLVGDAFNLPFRDRSFDLVFSSLFLHHFPNDEVVKLLASFGSIARRAVLAIDLERGPLAYYFMPSTKWIMGWRDITVHDGQISVQAAFKREELLALARQAGLTQARVTQHRPWARLSLVAPV